MPRAAEITVLQSAAFREAYRALAPAFERATGHKAVAVFAPGVQVMSRVKGGEIVDLVIMAAAAIDELIRFGKIIPGSRVDLGKSAIGVAVRAGAPKPDISSGDAVRRALLAAKSIAYSTGPSGVYLAGLFERMGIAGQLQPKLKQVLGEPAGAPVARGEAELAFQQVSELLPVPGIDIVGPLPPDIQKITVFSVGLHVGAKEPAAAQALVKFLNSPAAAPVIREKGMEPAGKCR